MQRFETTIMFLCPECEDASKVDVEVPELNISSDRFSEHYSEGWVEITCPNCECCFDADATCYYHGSEIKLHDYEQQSFSGDGPMYSSSEEDDYWHGYIPPEGSYEIFRVTYSQVLALLKQHVEVDDDEQIFTRMLFSQLISAMEAFLSDTLITNVIGSDEATKALLSKDKHANQQKFSIRAFAENPKLVEETLKKYLLDILYHNLAKVRFLYSAALNLDIFLNEDDENALLKAVDYRHDCVHRNGYDKDGKKLDFFTKVYVEEVGEAIERMVESVHSSLEKDAPF